MTRLRPMSRQIACAAILAIAGLVAPVAQGAGVPATATEPQPVADSPLDISDIDYPMPEEPDKHGGYTSAITHSHITLRPGQECRVAYAIRHRNDFPQKPQYFFRIPQLGPVPEGIEVVNAEGFDKDGGRAKFTIKRTAETPEAGQDTVELKIAHGRAFSDREGDPTQRVVKVTLAPSLDSGEVTVPVAPCH